MRIPNRCWILHFRPNQSFTFFKVQRPYSCELEIYEKNKAHKIKGEAQVYTEKNICSHRKLVGLLLYIPVNSYGHVGTFSSPSHTFFLGKLGQVVNQYFVHILSLVADNNPS